MTTVALCAKSVAYWVKRIEIEAPKFDQDSSDERIKVL